MITHYKGIALSKNKDIANFISTYHILDRDNYIQFLDDDEPLQQLVNKHYLKVSLYKTLFNLSPYIALLLILTKG